MCAGRDDLDAFRQASSRPAKSGKSAHENVSDGHGVKRLERLVWRLALQMERHVPQPGKFS
jgi:hypothetical protein